MCHADDQNPVATSQPPLVLFDGDCGFCNRSINFILSHERGERLRFASSKSEIGKTILSQHGIVGPPGSVVLIENGKLHTRTAALIHIATYLVAPWRWLGATRFVPSPLRDGVYGFIAANRYRFSSDTAACAMRSPAEQARFLA